MSEIAQLRKLQKIAFTGAKEWISRLGASLLEVMNKIFTMNELQILELYDTGAAEVQTLLSYFPHTLQRLNLCDNEITDNDVTEIA